MTLINWLVLGILVFVSSVCLSKNTDNDGDNDDGDAEDSVWQYRHHGMSMYTMVVSKGCTYLAGFIQSMYVRSQHRNSKNHADCDWQAWVTKKCSSCHIPSELCTGVMSCGTACALSTLKAPSDMMQNCNVSMSRGGGKRAFSFRHNFYNTMNLCSTTGGAHHTLSSAFGRRGVANNQPEGNQTSSSLQKKTSNGHGREVSNGNLKRWCRAFSRYIRNVFHFNEVRFVHSSPYWLVDVYKIGPKFGVPLMHTHGLVGCGMEYALNALNAPSWLDKFYRNSN